MHAPAPAPGRWPSRRGCKQQRAADCRQNQFWPIAISASFSCSRRIGAGLSAGRFVASDYHYASAAGPSAHLALYARLPHKCHGLRGLWSFASRLYAPQSTPKSSTVARRCAHDAHASVVDVALGGDLKSCQGVGSPQKHSFKKLGNLRCLGWLLLRRFDLSQLRPQLHKSASKALHSLDLKGMENKDHQASHFIIHLDRRLSHLTLKYCESRSARV